jgi:type IV pilus assembly protein PilQ
MNRALLFLIVILASVSGSASAQAPSEGLRVDLSMEEGTLGKAAGIVRKATGANIVFLGDGAELAQLPVELELTNVRWRTALKLAVEQAGCILEEDRDGILLISSPPRVTLQFPSADLVEIIDTIALVAGANVVVGPEVEGVVSVRFTDVPWRDALDVVARSRGFVVIEEDGGILRVTDPARVEEQLISHTYQLRFLRPKGNYVPKLESEFVAGGATPPEGGAMERFSVLRALEKVLSPNGAIEYVDARNAIVVHDSLHVHDQVQSILDDLDVIPVQVFCDVKFVATGNAELLNLGVDYGDTGPSVSLSGGQIPTTFPFSLGAGGFEDDFIASADGTGPFLDPLLNGGEAPGNTFVPQTMFGTLSFTQVQATLRLLQRDTSTEVIQSPKIIALDGHEATIFVGETIRYAEAKSEQGQAGGLQLAVGEADHSPVEVGFQLLIRPQVVPGTETIIMEVIPKETSLSGSGSSPLAPQGFEYYTLGAAGLEGSIALPRTRSSTLVTTMLIESGQTAVIGGLTTEAETGTETRVPILGDIPILGRLFRHDAKSHEQRSLLVFIRPTVVRSDGEREAILRRELNIRRDGLKHELERLIGPEEVGDVH